jgi:chaperonin GroEL (HSP60 family)
MIQEFENPVILVPEKKISSINSILPVLEMVVQVSHCHLFHALFERVVSFILIS